MKIGIASDHAGYELKEYLKKHLESKGFEVTDFGADSTSAVDYPDYAHLMGNAVDSGETEIGIAVCHTGNGMSIALNRHKRVRAALCWNEKTAELARRHNNANILSLPAGFISRNEAADMTNVFLTTSFEGGRHERRIEKI